MKTHAAGTGYALSNLSQEGCVAGCMHDAGGIPLDPGFQCEIFQHGISMGFKIINQLVSWDF
jgi:hypothetical protein